MLDSALPSLDRPPSGPPTGLEPARTAETLLALLHARGADRLRAVVLRRNRRTLWSLTRRGTVLNLHEAYARAPASLLDAFAELVREAPARSRAYDRARGHVAAWPEVHRAMGALDWRPPRCAATLAQRVYLRRLFRFLDATRFDGRLPDSIPIRLSDRFRRRLGQMVPGREAGRRVVREIALSVDLMLPQNDALREDTLLHEMAHAVHYLEEGGLDHGPRWRWWARRVGCEPRACREGPVHRRRDGVTRVTRVPPLPQGWRGRAVIVDAAGDGSSPADASLQARARTASAASTTASAVSPKRR